MKKYPFEDVAIPEFPIHLEMKLTEKWCAAIENLKPIFEDLFWTKAELDFEEASKYFGE